MPFHYVVTPSERSIGHRIFYKVQGDEDAPHKILLTMGLGGTHDQWQPQLEYFAQFPKEFQVCCYDNRGVGYSDPVDGRWTTRFMAKDAISLLNHLGWTKKVHLVGVSMGGMITQEIALLNLDRFASITLIATIAGGIPSLYFFAKNIPTGIRKLAMTFLHTDPREQLKSGLALLYPEEFLQEEAYNHEKEKHEPNFVRMRRALVIRGKKAKEDGMPPLRVQSVVKQALAVTTHSVGQGALRRMSNHFGEAALVITGDKDILVHQANSHILSKGIPSSKLVKITGSGHGVSEQCADEVNRAIRDVILAGDSRFSSKL